MSNYTVLILAAILCVAGFVNLAVGIIIFWCALERVIQ